MSHNYSPYIRENYRFLQRLAKTSSDKKKNTIILEASAEQILSIVEICANVLKHNFALNKRQKQKLAKFADFYRKISRKRTEKSARKTLQEGGSAAIAAILVPVLSALASESLLRSCEDE